MRREIMDLDQVQGGAQAYLQVYLAQSTSVFLYHMLWAIKDTGGFDLK